MDPISELDLTVLKIRNILLLNLEYLQQCIHTEDPPNPNTHAKYYNFTNQPGDCNRDFVFTLMNRLNCYIDALEAEKGHHYQYKLLYEAEKSKLQSPGSEAQTPLQQKVEALEGLVQVKEQEIHSIARELNNAMDNMFHFKTRVRDDCRTMFDRAASRALDYENEIHSLRTSLQQLERDRSHLRDAPQEEKDEKDKTITDLRQKLSDAQAQSLLETHNAENASKENKKLKKDNSSLSTQLTTAKGATVQAQQKVREGQRVKQMLEKTLEKQEDKLNAQDITIRGLRSRIRVLEKEKAQAEQAQCQNERLEILEGTVTSIKRTIEEQETKIATHAMDMQALKDHTKEIVGRVTKERCDRIEEYKRLTTVRDTKDAENKELMARNKFLEQEYEKIKAMNGSRENECEQLKQERSRAQETIDELRTEVEEKAGMIDKMRKDWEVDKQSADIQSSQFKNAQQLLKNWERLKIESENQHYEASRQPTQREIAYPQNNHHPPMSHSAATQYGQPMGQPQPHLPRQPHYMNGNSYPVAPPVPPNNGSNSTVADYPGPGSPF